MLLASVSSSFTSAVANHGIYAVFGLRWLCRVMPAWINLAILAWLAALIVVANAYLVRFAIG